MIVSRNPLVRLATLIVGMATICAHAQTPVTRIDDALQNITVLQRTGKVGYATIWDGNKYVQCRRQPDNGMRCEAAGATMQTSLRHVLTGERLGRIAALGWVPDASFGNYVQTFPSNTPTARIADHIVRILAEGYDANLSDLEIQTTWVANVPCPPRNGPSQNLAGSVNDAASMRPAAVLGCSYLASAETPQRASSAEELFAIYGAEVTAEIQRLRINAVKHVYAVFDAGIGYVQCAPETPTTSIYCEAQSVESWKALSAVLTPDRIAHLRNAGYTDPGRAPNYWKSYAPDKYADAVVAQEILAILYNVYGYNGAAKLNIKTER